MMGCACHALGGAADGPPTSFIVQPRRFPNVERVFAEYIAAHLRSGQPFYINPDLNSTSLAGVDPAELLDMFPTHKITAGAGMGQFEFLIPIFSAIAGAASAAGTAIIAAAPAIGSLAGSVSALTQVGMVANNLLASGNQPTIIPVSIAAQTAQAAGADAKGGVNLSTNDLLLIGGGLVIVLLLAR